MTRPNPPDYRQIIDAETWAFIDRSASHYLSEPGDSTTAAMRAAYDRMARAFHHPHPPGVRSRDEVIAGVRCRIYEGAGTAPATVLYFHGGGLMLGGLDSHDDVCAEITAATGCRTLSVDYRLAPEHRHPAQFDDAVAVFDSVPARWPGPVVLAGDSAGGTLAAALAHHARGQRRVAVAGLVLIYPGLGGDPDKGSYLTHAEAPMLTRSEALAYQTVRFAGGKVPTDDPTAFVLQDDDFSGLPPTLIHVAECDPLADDGPAYAERIRAAGGIAHCVTDRGLVHGHLRARHQSARARAAFAAVTEAISALGRGEVPWRGAL